MRETVKDTFFFEAVETFGSSTATSECSFSALSKIDTVRRQSMTDKRLCNLTFLAFEKKNLKDVDEISVMRKFAEKSRRVQLF